MRVSLNGLVPGLTYNIQARTKSEDGGVSEWSRVFTVTASTDATVPSAPTALTWAVNGTAFKAAWTAPTTNSNSTSLQDLRDYQITLFSPAAPNDKVIYYVTGNKFDLPFEVNSNSFSTPRAQVTIEVRARDTSGNLSAAATATAQNAAPANVTGLVVSGGQGIINSTWTANTDTDLKHYEVHMSQTAAFTAGPTNLVGITSATTYVQKVDAGQTWYVKIRAVDIFNSGSGSYAFGSATSRSITDGVAPSSSPTPTVISNIGSLFVRWTPVVNADMVQYDVHVSTTNGFTPSSSTLVGSTAGSVMTVRALSGSNPMPGQPDTRTLQYGVTYYVKIIARDADGAAAASAQALGIPIQVTGPDIAANSVTAVQVVAGSFTGEEFAGTVFIGNMFKTADTGRRAEFGVEGFAAFRSDNSMKFSVPTDDDGDVFVDGEFVARGLTVTGGASFQSSQNEITASSALTLMRGIVSPSGAPVLTVTYDKVIPTTANLVTSMRTGNLGVFHLVPSEVSCIEWKSDFNYWMISQVRTNGTRQWYFNLDGTPKDLYGNGTFFGDLVDWEVWSTCTIYSGAKVGSYAMFRHIPAGNTWWVSGPLGLNEYTRLNPNRRPVVGTNGTDIFVAEALSNNAVSVGYRSMTSTPFAPLPAASTTYTTAAGLVGQSLSEILLGSFDYGSVRYIISERGVNFNTKAFTLSGSTLVQQITDEWESPSLNRRGVGWDGANFWTYCSDGYFYKHTSEKWNPNTSSSVWWARTTFYDSNVAGTGTHETKPGPVRSIIMARRAKLNVTMPPIPNNGGVDDPNYGRLYMGRGATQPANTSMFLQYSGGETSTTLTTLSVATSNPPTLGNFPSATPALIRNDNDNLVISGDGSILTTKLQVGMGGSPVSAIRFGTTQLNFTPTAVLTHGMGIAPVIHCMIRGSNAYTIKAAVPTSTGVQLTLITESTGATASVNGIFVDWIAFV